jgi:formate C-acetyltransferase
MDLDGRALVTKSSYRMLHTLSNLGPAPEPNITVLWSAHMPAAFKRYCVKVSRDTSSLQYENDDLMRPFWGDDYGIACCVSAMRLGKQMQFFGARVNLAKALLYAINGGRDEISGEQVAPQTLPVSGDFLDFDDVMAKFDTTMEWLARTYVHAMNCIHYMHDKYFYERLEMALHDRDVLRTMAFGIAGLRWSPTASARSNMERFAQPGMRPDWWSTFKTRATKPRLSSATTMIVSTK